MSQLPSWVLELKPPGTEVKYINGRYYLYTASSSVRGEDGKPHKISGEYLGVLVKDVGLIKKGERDSKLQGKVRPKYSYGIAGTLTPLMGDELSRLRTLFPEEWQSIIAFALCRLSSGCPIYEMNKLWDQNFLSHFLTSVSFSEGDIKKTLKRIGSYAREDMESFFGTKVYLNLWVKVKEKWRDSAAAVSNFGYKNEDVT